MVYFLWRDEQAMRLARLLELQGKLGSRRRHFARVTDRASVS